MNLTNVKDFLSNKTGQRELENLKNQPALLFVNKKGRGFGNIYLFQKFGSEITNTLKMGSQITTHYMEDNTARQDHWALSPKIYVLSGLIGELVYTPPERINNYVQQRFTDYLAPLSVLLPTFDSYTQSAINVVQAVEASLLRYKQIAQKVFSNPVDVPTKKSNQEQVIEMLENLRANRQLVSVYTPYGTYESLAIQNVSATQNNSKYQSQLEIEFIEWRDFKTITRGASENDKALFAQMQQAQEEKLGNASTVKKSIWATRVDKNEALIQGF